ncbi:MAG: TRAP transporter TatT component family protein [Pseudomonadota bacterium]
MKLRQFRRAGLATLLLVLAGCGGLVDRFATNLGEAVFNQPDPEIIRDGMPSYLILLDSLIEGSPDNASLLSSASDIYAAYGAVFVRDETRAKILTARALSYAERAVCERFEPGCSWPDVTFDEFEASLERLDDDHATVANSYALASLAYIRAHSDDWAALARLPHIESLLLSLVPFTEEQQLGAVYNYLGVLNTLRPPALGGKPEIGRDYFERAIEMTGGKDLAVKVEFARGYARLVYDQELHDALLNDVLSSPAEVPGLTLTNTLAKDDARALLDSGADYF